MLALQLALDDRVVIELEDKRLIEVVLVQQRGGKSRIGFEAARSIGIYRGDVWQKIVQRRAAGEQQLEPAVDLRDEVAGATLI